MDEDEYLKEMETLYQEALKKELGELLEPPKILRRAIYEGEIAFALQVHCIKPDSSPCSIHSDHSRYYKFVLTGLSHDMMVLILMNLKDIFPPTSMNSDTRRSSIRKELESCGIGYMCNWITCCRNHTYTITIRHMNHDQCTQLSKVLFSW